MNLHKNVIISVLLILAMTVLSLNDAKLLLFSEDDRQFTWEMAHRIPYDPYRFSVVSRGAENIIEIDEKSVQPSEMASLIKNHPKYRAGMPVDLFASNTGKLDDGIAYKLAKELRGAPLTAPSGVNFLSEDGKEVIINYRIELKIPGTGFGVWAFPYDGERRTFYVPSTTLPSIPQP